MMKKFMIALLVAAISFTASQPAFASDWDKAGKALAIIEGLRIVTGGNVDLVGGLTGINKQSYGYSHQRRKNHYRNDKHKHYSRRNHYREHTRSYCSEKVWVPRVTWEKKFIPQHEVYDEDLGHKVIVEAHYVKYKTNDGGYWKTTEFDC